MTADQLAAFVIGAGFGVCVTLPLMLHWHLGRVRVLWRRWVESRG